MDNNILDGINHQKFIQFCNCFVSKKDKRFSMRKEDLKTGMVVEIKDYEGTKLAMVCDTSHYGLCISGENVYCPISHLTDDLKHRDNWANCYINRVYSLSSTPKYASNISTIKRELLWERKHTPKVGDVYKTSYGNEFVVTYFHNGGNTFVRMWSDGSTGTDTIKSLETEFKFTGKNIGDKVNQMLKELTKE